jgi:hypothetical protein
VLAAVIVGLMRVFGGSSAAGEKTKGNSKAFLVILCIVVVIYLLLLIEARGPEIKSWLVSTWNSTLINIVQPVGAMSMSVALLVLVIWVAWVIIRSWWQRR